MSKLPTKEQMEGYDYGIRDCIVVLEEMLPHRLDGLISREKAIAALKALLGDEVKP